MTPAPAQAPAATKPKRCQCGGKLAEIEYMGSRQIVCGTALAHLSAGLIGSDEIDGTHYWQKPTVKTG